MLYQTFSLWHVNISFVINVKSCFSVILCYFNYFSLHTTYRFISFFFLVFLFDWFFGLCLCFCKTQNKQRQNQKKNMQKQTEEYENFISNFDNLNNEQRYRHYFTIIQPQCYHVCESFGLVSAFFFILKKHIHTHTHTHK